MERNVFFTWISAFPASDVIIGWSFLEVKRNCNPIEISNFQQKKSIKSSKIQNLYVENYKPCGECVDVAGFTGNQKHHLGAGQS